MSWHFSDQKSRNTCQIILNLAWQNVSIGTYEIIQEFMKNFYYQESTPIWFSTLLIIQQMKSNYLTLSIVWFHWTITCGPSKLNSLWKLRFAVYVYETSFGKTRHNTTPIIFYFFSPADSLMSEEQILQVRERLREFPFNYKQNCSVFYTSISFEVIVLKNVARVCL